VPAIDSLILLTIPKGCWIRILVIPVLTLIPLPGMIVSVSIFVQQTNFAIHPNAYLLTGCCMIRSRRVHKQDRGCLQIQHTPVFKLKSEGVIALRVLVFLAALLLLFAASQNIKS
jgi:hypothetical protein